MVRKQVIRLTALVLAAVAGGLCSAQPKADSSIKGSSQPTTSPDSRTVMMDPNALRKVGPVVLRKYIPVEELRQVLPGAVKRLDWGTATFSFPKSMRYKQSQVLEVVFSRNVPVDQLRQRLAQAIGVEADQIELPTLMTATLPMPATDAPFNILAITSDRQSVTSAQKGQWQWTVTPVQAGQHTLHLVLSSVVKVGAESIPCDIRTYEQPVLVTITLWQRITDFLKEYWQWVCTVLLIPIVGFLVKLYRKRTRRTLPDS